MTKTSHASVVIWLAAGLWSVAGRQDLLQLFGVVVLVVFGAVASSLTPLMLRDIVNALDIGDVTKAWVSLVAYGVLFLAGALMAAFRWMLYGPLEQRCLHDLSVMYMKRILAAPFNIRTGSIDAAVSQAQIGQRNILSTLVINVAPTLTETAFVLVLVTVTLDSRIALVVAATLAIYSGITWYGAELSRRHQKFGQQAFIDARGLATECYMNAETVRLYGAITFLAQRYANGLAAARTAFKGFFLTRGLTSAVQGVGLAVALALCLGMSIGDFAAGSVGLGEVVMVNAFVLQTLRPIQSLNLHYREIKSGLTAVENLMEMFGQQQNLVPSGSKLVASESGVLIEAWNLATNHSAPVSLSVAAGKITALIGPSGAGKTSVVRAIAKVLPVNDGQLTVNGIAINELDVERWHGQIAVVSQEGLLFHDTIRENIRLGRNDIDDNEILRLLAEVGVERDPEDDCGARGQNLSGGERQRIAIIRAILRKPVLLVLDEALAQMDMGRAQDMLELVQNELPDAAILLVTHSRALASLGTVLISIELPRGPTGPTTSTNAAVV